MSYQEIDWENRSEWLLIADKIDELADAVEKSPITGIDNGVRDIRFVRNLVESTRSLAHYYRNFSHRVVSK